MEECAHEGCSAVPLSQANCLGHATAQELAIAVERWHLGATLDARETRVDEVCLQRLSDALEGQDPELIAMPLGSGQRAAFCGEVNFEGATFLGEADFSKVVFRGPAYFDGAEFCGRAEFRRAEFLDHADFDNAVFRSSVSFRGAMFADHAGFQNVRALGGDVQV